MTHDDSLEAATSRLEDIAISQSAASTIAGHSPPAAPPAPAAANSSSATASPVPGAQAQAQSPPLSIKAFDELLEGPLAKYVELSQAVGGVVAEQVGHGSGGGADGPACSPGTGHTCDGTD